MIPLLYVFFAMVAAIYLARKTDRKALSFVLILWLLAQPVINAKFIIDLPGLPFDLQPNRILLLFSILYLFWGQVSGRKAHPGPWPPFEKYILFYFVMVLVALLVNRDFVPLKSVIAVPIEIFNFLVVYTLAKRNMTEKTFEAILKAVVLLAVIGALIAIVQISVDSTFMRMGDLRRAFGDKLRSTGIFRSEYDFGYFQILALMVVLIRYQGRAIRFVVGPLLVLSVLLTFHRLDYIILFACYVSYRAFFSKRKLGAPVIAMAVVVPVILVLTLNIYQSMGGRSAVLEERLKQDTVTGRFVQYRVVWDSILKYPLGLGSYDHPDYVKLMSRHDMIEWITEPSGKSTPRPLTVHNGYLAVGIQYGFLGMVAFSALVLSMLLYFRKLISPDLLYSPVAFYAVLIYALSNVSNSVSIFRAYFVVFLAILCGSLVALHRAELARRRERGISNSTSANVASA